MKCYHCHTDIDLIHKPRRQDTCDKCGSYIHCCKNCNFYSETAPKQCKEPAAELVSNKELGNYCVFFEPGTGATPDADRAAIARKKLEELFKKPK